MPEQEVVKERVFVDPFQVGRKIAIMPGMDLSDAHIMRLVDTKIDHETGQAYPVYDSIDLQQEIDARKHDCGFDLMKKMIATGQATPADFADDGQHGVDFSGIPDSVHDLAKSAQQSSESVASLLAVLGVKDGDVLTQEMLERLLTDKVAEIYKKQQAAAVVVEETSK